MLVFDSFDRPVNQKKFLFQMQTWENCEELFLDLPNQLKLLIAKKFMAARRAVNKLPNLAYIVFLWKTGGKRTKQGQDS